MIDVEELTKMGSKKLENFALEDSRVQDQCPNLSFLFKMETKDMRCVCKDLVT